MSVWIPDELFLEISLNVQYQQVKTVKTIKKLCHIRLPHPIFNCKLLSQHEQIWSHSRETLGES